MLSLSGIQEDVSVFKPFTGCFLSEHTTDLMTSYDFPRNTGSAAGESGARSNMA